ncbi:serine/threonine protein kinase [Colletotrichum musicola]|uniref:Serine/threonine protein kinase n=1 Tax=Colletotrichum musicola TaxID=2175873 RepID=A0A8H6JFG4_9PEZI|nr:serine/threonine protein kinase [Colletotrichum musicola]
MSDDAIEDFHSYVDNYTSENNCIGENGFGERREFISRPALTAYWTPEKVNSVLCYQDQWITGNCDIILRDYVIVFSSLVMNSRPENIVLFCRAGITDTRLPLDSVPLAYSEAPEATIFREFMKSQWRFCPLTFGREPGTFPVKRDIDPYQIVPVVEKEKLDPQADESEDESVIYKVKLHQDCADFSDYVVFKEYPRKDHETEQLYQNEATMFSQLGGIENSFKHIVQHYGSFEQQLGKRTIVLEYARGDTLKAFFNNQPPPRSYADRIQFWSNFFGLLKGLEAIQDFTKAHNHNDTTYRLKGHIRVVRNGGIDRPAVDQHGNGMYSPPEVLRDDMSTIIVSFAGDIWSFGGIASEALIWSIWGEHGRMKYQIERNARTRTTRLAGGNHQGAFHDGDRLLDVVKKWHDDAIQKSEGIGIFTKELSDIILELMLVADPKSRTSDAAKIFLIDDSISMMPHRKRLMRVSRVLGYLLKRGEVDPDGFELFFASAAASAAHIHKSTRLQVAIEDHSFAEPQCEIGPALDEIVTAVLKQDNPVSIYVLTNGHWDLDEVDPSCGVEGPVGRLTKHIKVGNRQKNWAVVQFIRFYDITNPKNWQDERGKNRLRFLDDELTARLEYQQDIVDTRDFNQDVGRMLLGAISPKSDKVRSY